MTITTINILAQELQIKQKRLDKYRDKIYEQQEYLKHKIKRIDELKEEVASLKDDWEMCDTACDEKQFEIMRLRKEMSAMAEELSYSRGEHPIQKATDRKRKQTNGKIRKTDIN